MQKIYTKEELDIIAREVCTHLDSKLREYFEALSPYAYIFSVYIAERAIGKDDTRVNEEKSHSQFAIGGFQLNMVTIEDYALNCTIQSQMAIEDLSKRIDDHIEKYGDITGPTVITSMDAESIDDLILPNP